MRTKANELPDTLRLADELAETMFDLHGEEVKEGEGRRETAPPKKKPRRIYVAGALSGTQPGDNTYRLDSTVVVDYIKNVSTMCWIAGRLQRKGYSPYVPGLDLLLGLVCNGFNEEDYRSLSLAFLEVCDAVLVISLSPGVNDELVFARKLGIPIYYTLEELEAA